VVSRYGGGALGAGDVGKGKGSPYSITERRVPELIPVHVSHKPGVMYF